MREVGLFFLHVSHPAFDVTAVVAHLERVSAMLVNMHFAAAFRTFHFESPPIERIGIYRAIIANPTPHCKR
jgi:hypothetical protein